jgi:uncharacterized protein with HEPN domain
VPWRRIADFRNVAVHEYFSIEWSLVWRLVQDRLPILRPPYYEGDRSRVSRYRFAVRRTP